jgi:hypothetical protein
MFGYSSEIMLTSMHSVKKVIVFPVPSRDVTNENLPGRKLLNYSRPGRIWFVTSRLESGKRYPFFTVYVPAA